MNLQKCTSEPYSFSVNDTTLASNNHLSFRRNLLERIQKLIMKIEDKIRDEKLQKDINTEVAKISSLSSSQIEAYECLSGEEILPLN